MARVVSMLAIVVAFLSLSFMGPSQAQSFRGDVVATWLSDGRQMELAKPFAFIDAKGTSWLVPKGAKVDGASIPRVLWSAIGSPYLGKYRRASVVHDYYCDTMSRPWKDVHEMFYEAALAEGNGEIISKLMFAAVYRWGPRWDYINGKPTRLRSLAPMATPKDLEKIAAWIKEENPSPEEIAKRLGKPPR